MEQWVLIGVMPKVRRKDPPISRWDKAFGPFASEDEAREACNELGMPGIHWEVLRLYTGTTPI